VSTRIVLLGSTGSIGTQTLDVVARMRENFEIVALAAGTNAQLLAAQISTFSPKYAFIADAALAHELAAAFPHTQMLSSPAELDALAALPEADVIVNAIVGARALPPSLSAVRAGKLLCTANKESLVMAGEFLTRELAASGARIIPIDSEHSALWQAMRAGERAEIASLILTASGGPFFRASCDLSKISPQDALAHPNWSMGAKISVDSATMMNKALEIIEAFWLFAVPASQIRVLIHPQSIVHSIVEFIDGSQIAQMSLPDMRLPIQYALTFPHRLPTPTRALDLSKVGTLEFFEPDFARFVALAAAYEALELGSSAAAALSSANEAAVAAFLAGRISFADITLRAVAAMREFATFGATSVEDIIELDAQVQKSFAASL